MIEKQKPFVKHGASKEHIKITADGVLNAIAEGRDIDIEYADIDGDLDIGKIADRLERDKNEKIVIEGSIRIDYSTINGDANFESAIFKGHVSFNSAIFSGNASFGLATFSGNVFFSSAIFSGVVGFSSATFSGGASFISAIFSRNAFFWSAIFSRNASFSSAIFSENAFFWSATFSGDASFWSATFSGGASFRSATFTKNANFDNVIMEYPGNFSDVAFRENTLLSGIWNATLGRMWLRMPVTDFYKFNTEVVMDASSNPWLKRYIDDEQWIRSWRMRPKRHRLREALFTVWEITSHCGRSFILWMCWSVAVAIAFAFIYQAFGYDSIGFNVDELNGQQPGLWGYIYYSIVSFTTLGFGDIVPLTTWARLAIGAEVVLGYIMLGGLVSIFVNKLARRS